LLIGTDMIAFGCVARCFGNDIFPVKQLLQMTIVILTIKQNKITYKKSLIISRFYFGYYSIDSGNCVQMIILLYNATNIITRFNVKLFYIFLHAKITLVSYCFFLYIVYCKSI